MFEKKELILQLENRSDYSNLDSYKNINKKLENIFLIENLFKYINKNKFIPNFLLSISAEDPSLQALLSTLEKGDTTSEIFNHPNCYLYLLYLIQQEKISFWQGITAYVYLTALMQFTNQQPLRTEDVDVKLIREFKVNYLIKNRELTDEGKSYLEAVCINFKNENYDIDYSELVNFAHELSKVEQWLLKIPFKVHSYHEHDYDRLIKILVINTPFLIYKREIGDQAYFWLPSISLINYLLNQISKPAIKMLPILGSIGKKTLFNFHSNNTHPLALYAPHVKSNPQHADNNRCGPFAMLIHDISHTYWGSRLTFDERKIIFSEYIPHLQRIKELAQTNNDYLVEEIIDCIVDETVDYQVSLHTKFKNHKTRLTEYLRYIFVTLSRYDADFFKQENCKLGNSVAQRIIFLSYKKFNENSQASDAESIWSKTVLTENRSFLYGSKHNIIKALISLWENNAQHSEKYDASINWHAWLELLKLRDSKKIWDIVIKSRHDELLLLIAHYNLKFFHPFLPLTEEKLNELQEFILRKILIKENQHSISGNKSTNQTNEMDSLSKIN